jgi:hypothetical protein
VQEQHAEARILTNARCAKFGDRLGAADVLAFTPDQIQQTLLPLLPSLMAGIGYQDQPWSAIRYLFNVLVFKSIGTSYHRLTTNYRLQLE